MTPDSSYTTAIPYHSLSEADLSRMRRDATWLLFNERNPEVLAATRKRYYAVKCEQERRGVLKNGRRR